MKKQKAIAFISLVCCSFLFISWSSSTQFRLNRIFEIYGNAVKEITGNYIDEVPAETLLKASMDNMLSSLDPYAEYFAEENEDDVKLLTDGNYIGFGFSVTLIDSMLTIVKIRDNTPAYNAGLKVGDILYSVDGNVVIKKDDIQQYSRGASGTVSDFRIIREFAQDTLDYAIKRTDIHIPSVTFVKLLDSNIAYIKIDRFSRRCAVEFMKAFNKLYAENKLRGLIIDVRDNPGGILLEAVSICEMFVPNGSKIVSTKGRHSKYDYEYYSHNDPIDTTLPIAVLINNNSASASEILAGAMQDLDRAVVIGKTSYGKGLVQMVFELSDKHSIKFTTAKYYTPSGRCIQKVDYSGAQKDTSRDTIDTALFYTHNGRTVYESNGIKPDCEVQDKKYNQLLISLVGGNTFFRFANIYCSQNENNRFEYEMNENIYNDFVKFATKRVNSQKLEQVQKMLDIKENVAFSSKSKHTIDKAIESIESDIKYTLLNNLTAKEDAKKILDYEIKTRFYSEGAVYEDLCRNDIYIAKSKNLFFNGKYKQMLAGASQNNEK